MTTLVLAAGSSQAYADAGRHFPKNLHEAGGRPLIQHVLESLGGLANDLVVVLPTAEVGKFRTDRVVELLHPGSTVVSVGNTSGAACSALMACAGLDAGAPLVVTSGDALLDVDLEQVVASFDQKGLDAGCVVFEAVHPRVSFVKLEDGLVVQASEKDPISTWATAGFYWFRNTGAFVAASMRMIEKGAHVQGQYYVCPALNELVLEGARIGVHVVPRSSYFSFRDPSEVATYESHLLVAPQGGASR